MISLTLLQQHLPKYTVQRLTCAELRCDARLLNLVRSCVRSRRPASVYQQPASAWRRRRNYSVLAYVGYT